jgi:hypothetical protein
MRNPAEVFTAGFKASLLERRGIFSSEGRHSLHALSRHEVCSSGRFERQKTVVHVNYHTNAFRCEQVENIARAIQLFPGAMATADRVYADNEVKGVLQFRRFLSKAAERSRSNVSLSPRKFNGASFTRREIIFCFPVGGFNQNRRKVRLLRSQP